VGPKAGMSGLEGRKILEKVFGAPAQLDIIIIIIIYYSFVYY
jgi:hypothetical protein